MAFFNLHISHMAQQRRDGASHQSGYMFLGLTQRYPSL
jgi:hypothetical protein